MARTPFVTATAAHETALAGYMRQIFNYMTGGVALSGLVAWMVASNPQMVAAAASGGTQLVFFVIWLAFAFLMHKVIFSMPPAGALAVFAIFSAFTGFALAPIALVYTGSSIATAFFVAAGMFAGVSAYGYFSKKSLSSWGTFLNMAGWGLIALIIVQLVMALFFGGVSSGFSMLVSALVIPFVAGVTAYEVNMLKEMFDQHAADEEQTSKMAIYGAASLYMNFVVLFLHLLNLLGQQRN